jgi:hypothetical protein
MFQKSVLAGNHYFFPLKKLLNFHMKTSEPFTLEWRHGTVLFSVAVKFTQMHEEV